MVDANKITSRNDVALKRRLIEEREDAIRNYAADMSQAKEEGAHDKAIETAKKMIAKGLSTEDIAEFTGLSIEEIKALQ